jgi:membrane-bound lytic murein transglycosylase A
VELTPMRSVATDPEVVPSGTIGYLVTPTIRRFVVAQDIGAAIRGAHADLFAGSGREAEQFAGRQKEMGTMYVLVPL